MEIQALSERPELDQNKRCYQQYDQLQQLLAKLRKRALPPLTIEKINESIALVNAVSGTEKQVSKQIRKSQSQIVQLIEKTHQLVTQNHYRKTWMAVGLSAFGIPIGITLGLSQENMALHSIGLPIGIAIGIAIGTAKDKKAMEEGRQLDLELKY